MLPDVHVFVRVLQPGRQVRGRVLATVPKFNQSPEQLRHCSFGTKVCEPACLLVHLLPAQANSQSQEEKMVEQLVFPQRLKKKKRVQTENLKSTPEGFLEYTFCIKSESTIKSILAGCHSTGKGPELMFVSRAGVVQHIW